MTEIQNSKREYDLEVRTFQFAKAVRLFDKALSKHDELVKSPKQVQLSELI